MKKLLAFVLLMFGITLASCGGPKQDLTTLRKNDIDTNIATNLHITFDNEKGSTKLYKEKRDGESYFDVYIAEDYVKSLFVYELDVDAYITDRTQQIFANTLTFNITIYQDEQQAILNEVYNKDYGISKLTFPFKADTTKAFSKNAFEDFVIPASKDLSELKLSVVYLPVMAYRVYKNQPVLKTYMFIPVHMSFVSAGKLVKGSENDKGYELVEKEITGIDVITPLFDDNNINLLAKPKEEKPEK